jgi:hypothetical protein
MDEKTLQRLQFLGDQVRYANGPMRDSAINHLVGFIEGITHHLSPRVGIVGGVLGTGNSPKPLL